MKRKSIVALAGMLIPCLALAAILGQGLLSHTPTQASTLAAQRAHRANTINDLTNISIVGNTSLIVDQHGATVAVDANPYGVAIVPRTKATLAGAPGTLKAGDIVVTNIGANDGGTTLVRFPAQKGPGLLFNTATNANTLGPADEAFNPLNGHDWVSNVGTNAIQVFDTNGKVLDTIKDPLFNKPWGQASNQGVHNHLDGSVISFFVSNVLDATIDRVDVIPAQGKTTFRVFQIGRLKQAGPKTKIGLLWVPSLHLGQKHLSDVLLALDPAQNRIAAFPNSTTLNTTNTPATDQGTTVFQGKPLNVPGGFTINPLNGDLLVVNLNDNNLVELDVNRGQAVGTRQLDNVPVDLQSGNGSALFGVVATTDQKRNLVVYFTDDNTNTLDMLSNL